MFAARARSQAGFVPVHTHEALTALAGTVRDLTSMLRAQADLRPRVERCERDIEGILRRNPNA